MSLPQEGWYPDPEGGLRLRWWDGADWTDRYRTQPLDRSSLVDEEEQAMIRRRAQAEAERAQAEARRSGMGLPDGPPPSQAQPPARPAATPPAVPQPPQQQHVQQQYNYQQPIARYPRAQPVHSQPNVPQQPTNPQPRAQHGVYPAVGQPTGVPHRGEPARTPRVTAPPPSFPARPASHRSVGRMLLSWGIAVGTMAFIVAIQWFVSR